MRDKAKRPLSRFGLYLSALCSIFGVSQVKVAEMGEVSPSTLSELKSPYPDRPRSPDLETAMRVHWVFSLLYEERRRTDAERKRTWKAGDEPVRELRLPSGWWHGLYYVAPSGAHMLDTLLYQIDALARESDPNYQSELPDVSVFVGTSEFDELKAMYKENLLYLERVERRSRCVPAKKEHRGNG